MSIATGKMRKMFARSICFAAAFASVFVLGFPVFYLVARYIWSPDYILFHAGVVIGFIAVAAYLAIVFAMSLMTMSVYKRLCAYFTRSASTD